MVERGSKFNLHFSGGLVKEPVTSLWINIFFPAGEGYGLSPNILCRRWFNPTHPFAKPQKRYQSYKLLERADASPPSTLEYIQRGKLQGLKPPKPRRRFLPKLAASGRSFMMKLRQTPTTPEDHEQFVPKPQNSTHSSTQLQKIVKTDLRNKLRSPQVKVQQIPSILALQRPKKIFPFESHRSCQALESKL